MNETSDNIIAQKIGEARGMCKRTWWAFLIGGIASVAFGILAFINPGAALFVLATFFAASVLVDGAVNIWGSIVGDRWQPQMVIDFEKYCSGDPANDELALDSLSRAAKKLKTITAHRAGRLLGYYLKDRGILSDEQRKRRFWDGLKQAQLPAQRRRSRTDDSA